MGSGGASPSDFTSNFVRNFMGKSAVTGRAALTATGPGGFRLAGGAAVAPPRSWGSLDLPAAITVSTGRHREFAVRAPSAFSFFRFLRFRGCRGFLFRHWAASSSGSCRRSTLAGGDVAFWGSGLPRGGDKPRGMSLMGAAGRGLFRAGPAWWNVSVAGGGGTGIGWGWLRWVGESHGRRTRTSWG